MSRADLRAVLGEPDDLGGGSRKREPPIDLYGDLEFHFGPEPGDGLVLIYRDDGNGSVDISIR